MHMWGRQTVCTNLLTQNTSDRPHMSMLQSPAQDIADMDSIVVCGPAFEALTAMGQLEAAGGDMSRVQHCGLVEQGSSLSTLLRGAAPLAGVTLPETIQVCVTWLLFLGLPH